MSKRSRQVLSVVVILTLAGLGFAFAEPRADSANLLVNSGAEDGAGDRPTAWRAVALPGGDGDVRFVWDREHAHGGARSLRLDALGSRRAIWSQSVAVSGGVVYELSGHVAFADLARDADAHLQVVFRGAGDRLLEFVDLARHHSGSRGFERDFSARMLFRAPVGAVRAEVNGYLQGPGTAWFDDLSFAPAPVGSIAGCVTFDGVPVEGARVSLWGDPWGVPIEATTDAEGRYRLDAVPVAHPRYLLIAGADASRTEAQGGVAVAEGATTRVDFELDRGQDPIDNLEVGYGFLCLSHPQERIELPAYAPLPDDRSGYVAEVRPYLESDEIVTSDDPTVVRLAGEIVDALPASDRGNAVAVARAVYDWVSVNVNHDAVYGNRQPYQDVTSGIWQTIQPGGWCWGRSFYDWGYRPTELLEERVGICVEHSWLSAALLRALNIPARARVGSAQFWIQGEDGTGAWFGISTNGGSNTYRETGRLGDGFGGSSLPTFYSATSTPFLQEDWDWTEPGVWRERHPWGEIYSGDDAGRAQATADLAHFAVTGDAPGGTAKQRPGSDAYEINYSQITLCRWSLADQPVIDIRFPMPTESPATSDTDEWAYWTNHPECVIDTYVETIENPPVAEVERWRHLVFDVSSLLRD